MPPDATGLDIGGANLKAATAAGWARTRPFELWRHPNRLADELAVLARELPSAGPVGITMTGELCDCFPTKRDGVRHILAAVAAVFGPRRVRIWSTTDGWQSVTDASLRPAAVAAANWHALATFAGRFAPEGLAILVDVGSTTTDVIALRNGTPVPTGKTDPERLRTSELVYTGTRRTPVCALLGTEVAAELFATTLDVYVRLGQTPEEPDDHATADGRPATVAHAHARLSRMLGGDPEITPEEETLALARKAFDRQRMLVADAICAATRRLGRRPGTIVVSGSGEQLALAAIRVIEVDTWKVVSLAAQLGDRVSEAAGAFAVAVLAAEAAL